MNLKKTLTSMMPRISWEFAAIIARHVIMSEYSHANYLTIVVLCWRTAIQRFKCHENLCFEPNKKNLQHKNICNSMLDNSNVFLKCS